MPGPAPKRPSLRARKNKASTKAKLRSKAKRRGSRVVAVRAPALPSRACVCGGPAAPPKRGAKPRRGRPRKPKTCDLCAGTGILAWHPFVKRWWAQIWASPMSDEFHESDIHRLYMAASLMEAFWMAGGVDTKLHGEIRLALAPFGTTPLDRRRLDWELPSDAAEESDGGPPLVTMADPRVIPQVPDGRPN